MTPGLSLRTARLLLRPWRDADRKPFAAMNADPRVMRYFPATMSGEESDAFVDRILAEWEAEGFGLWALELPEAGEFIGYTGLHRATFAAPFTPAIEIGWRLRPEHWDHGYATEAAAATLADGFGRAGIEEVVSFTATVNERSQRVMRRLGMHRDADFEHPALPEGHHLRRHVLYRLRAGEWLAAG